MKDLEFQRRIEQQFDSFCKKSLINAHRSILRNQQYRNKYEYPMDALQLAALAESQQHDLYHNRDVKVSINENCEILISLPLATALQALSEEHFRIIIGHYFMRMSDREIAQEMNMGNRTVSRRRNDALSVLQSLMKEGDN